MPLAGALHYGTDLYICKHCFENSGEALMSKAGIELHQRKCQVLAVLARSALNNAAILFNGICSARDVGGICVTARASAMAASGPMLRRLFRRFLRL